MMISFLLTACADTWDSVKRGMTGAKKKSSDEFLVKKKDPLSLPPDFENLPTPADTEAVDSEMESIKKVLKKTAPTEDSSTSGSSSEESILRQIKNK